MSPTVFTASVYIVSPFEGKIGGETFPATRDQSCSIEGSADPRTEERQSSRRPPTPDGPSQYGVKRLYPPLYKPACRQKGYSRCEGELHTKQQGFQQTPDMFVNSPLCPLRTLLLVQRSDDRDLQLWRKHAHTSSEGKETSSKVDERLLGDGPTNMIIE